MSSRHAENRRLAAGMQGERVSISDGRWAVSIGGKREDPFLMDGGAQVGRIRLSVV